MNNKNSVIQSLWIGKKITNLEQLSIVSFLKNGHSFHLYIYDDVKHLPEGVKVLDASKIIPPDKIFKYKENGSYAGFANLFRYKLLLENGGWWVDTDVICLHPFQLKPEHIFASEFSIQIQANIVASCIIKAPIGSEIMQYCYDFASKCDTEELRWGETGPKLMTKAVIHFGMQKYVAAPHLFCPIEATKWYLLKEDLTDNPHNKKIISKLKQAFAVHFWNELWRQSNTKKNADFPTNSIYEILKSRYLSK